MLYQRETDFIFKEGNGFVIHFRIYKYKLHSRYTSLLRNIYLCNDLFSLHALFH